MMLIAGLLNNSNYRQRGDGNTQQHARHTLDGVKNAGVPVVARQETPPPDPKPKRDEWRQEQDLQAQWQQADWAKYAAIAAFISLGVTALGVWFVAQTLVATREAVTEAANATKATERAVEVQLRIEQPYLFVEAILVRFDKIELDPWDEVFSVNQIVLQVRNVGKGTAILTEWAAHCEALHDLPERPAYSNAIKVRGRLFPRDEREEYPIHLSENQAHEIRVAHETAYLWGYFKYEDVFGRTRQTGFGYIGHPYSSLPDEPADGLLWSRIGGKAYNYDREEDA